MRRARGRTFEVAAHEDGEEAGGEEAGGQEAGGEEADVEDGLIDMEQELLGRGAELPSASVLLHQLSQVGGVNDRGFELLRLEDLLWRHRSQPEVATACITQYNFLMEGLGAESGIGGKSLPSDLGGAEQRLQADCNFVPFVVLEVLPPAALQPQLVAALTFEVKLPASPLTTVARLALWDVITRADYRRRHVYKDAHRAVALELVRNVRGPMCIELHCEAKLEVIAAHMQAGYYCTAVGTAAQEALPTEQVELAKAVVQTMRAAPGSGVYNRTVPMRGSEPTPPEAKVLERIESELGAASGDRLEIRRAAVRTALCPPPLLQPVTSVARSEWMGKAGVAECVIRRADSWARRAHELLCEYLVTSADGPPSSLLARGARAIALTFPRARTNETPEWVATRLREALGLPWRARIPDDVAVLSAIDVAVAALVGPPPQDLPQGWEEQQQIMLRTHLLDGRCRRGQGVYRRPCVLCEAYPLVLAAMEQLVALATSHADCCLPAAVQRPAASAPRCIVSVTLRREGIGARTPQSPPLWAMCVHAAAHMHMTPHPLTLFFRATLSITDTTRRGDAGVATLRGVASHLRDQLHPEAGATLAHAAILERLRGCAAQAEPRNGDAEAAAAVMCARGELACRECHKHAGDPARIGLPLILTALDQQRKRPRVEVNAESIDWTKLQAGRHGAELSCAHHFNQLADGLGGQVLQ